MTNNDGLQYHVHLQIGDVGRYVILPGDPFRTDLIASFLDDARLVAHNRELKTWTGYLDGVKVSVTSTGMGGPSAAIAVEELIECGADTFIRVGTAGKIADAAKADDVYGVICTAAVRDEGTSKEYVPVEYPAYADRHVVDALSRAAKAKGLKYLEGITHCKDSFYGQVASSTIPVGDNLDEKYRSWKKANVLCTEMESAIIFTVSKIRNVRAGSIMSFKDVEKTIAVAIEAIKLLIKEDE